MGRSVDTTLTSERFGHRVARRTLSPHPRPENQVITAAVTRTDDRRGHRAAPVGHDQKRRIGASALPKKDQSGTDESASMASVAGSAFGTAGAALRSSWSTPS